MIHSIPVTQDAPDRFTISDRTRETLARALQVAREAVQLDSDNNAEEAIEAYSRCVVLVREVIELVGQKGFSLDTVREEDVRRLQDIVSFAICDLVCARLMRRCFTQDEKYANRMNLLRAIRGIPAQINEPPMGS